MKRTISVVSMLLLLGGAVFAQEATRLDAAAPKDARTMAMGGAFIAMSEGYQSLYGNPASFADKKAELTLISMTPWVYVRPTTSNIETFQSIVGAGDDTGAMIGGISDLVADNGFGGGVSAGLGWVGKGLGLGVVGGGEVYVSGENLIGATGTLDGSMAAVVGIGIPLQLGPFRLQVGGDVRPYLRMTGDVVAAGLVGGLLGSGSGFDPMSLPVDLGFGLAVDLGAKLDLGNLLSVGLAIRDISTKQNFSSTTLGGALEKIQSGDLAAGANPVEYAALPNITLGASLTPIPVGLRKLIDVTVIAEIQDPIRVIVEQSTPWNLFHLGVEADLLGGLLAVRTGLNKGWISLGAGLDLLIMEVNVAVFTEELGLKPGYQPRTGISAEVAIRF
ncbi:MAG: hypothetical protein KKA67_01620 [Spirochaetes bacterium]|nr:hypothetical protein [Spirochaetota bacterium]MBU1082417.1 hypothetical protein [Spirochaetota bacterium]